MEYLIRSMIQSDLEVADRLNVLAFGYSESRLTDLSRNFTVQPDGWFVAEQDGTLLATIGVMDYGGFAHIGQLSVAEQHRRRGIGRSMMEHALEWIQNRNIPTATLDASEMGFPLYHRMGFQIVDHSCFYSLPKPPFFIPETEFIDFMQAADLGELCALDAQFFSGDRSQLLRALWKDFPCRSLIARDEHGHISGYLIVQGRKLGPWVARSALDAEWLLQAALKLNQTDQVFSIVPSTNLDADQLLRRYGFLNLQKNPHMFLGTKPEQVRAKIYGQVSFGIG